MVAACFSQRRTGGFRSSAFAKWCVHTYAYCTVIRGYRLCSILLRYLNAWIAVRTQTIGQYRGATLVFKKQEFEICQLQNGHASIEIRFGSK